MSTLIDAQVVEGEVALTIDYPAGKAGAIAVLAGAAELVAALDELDRALLSSVDTCLEPVSILNDVQHSSLKILLARAIRSVPDSALSGLDWKAWVGGLLVKGKHRLLQALDADAPGIDAALAELRPDYARAPGLAGYEPPTVAQAQQALLRVRSARRALPDCAVEVQTELGRIELPSLPPEDAPAAPQVCESRTNRGREWLKVRSPDMLGNAQWTVMRAGRTARVTILHREWLDAYHRREVALLPGDALDCEYEETIDYDADGNELARRLAVIQVHGIKSPPRQLPLPT